MKHIKAKFRLSSPGTLPFESYGWESLWTKKTAIVNSIPVEVGQIVDFQPVVVQRDGKCLILATSKNIRKIKAMVEKRQMALAPGETLEVPEFKPAQVVEDAWPEPVTVEVGAAESVAIAKPAPKPRKVSKADLTPDVEG